MIFPELRERLKAVWPDSSPVSLDLKTDVLGTFSPSDIAWYRDNGYQRIFESLGGGWSSYSGESVTIQTALRHSVVWACNRIISESIGFLPAHVMQMRNGARRHAEELPIYAAMKYEPNPEITAQSFRELLTSHCLLQGNGYSQIFRRSGTGVATELRPLDPAGVTTDREKTGQKRLVYVIKEGNEQGRTYTVQSGKPHDILHLRGLGWDGLVGHSVIEIGRNSIGSAIAAERNAGRLWAMGGRIPYILELEKDFRTSEEAKEFRKDWEVRYAQLQSVPMLPPGIKYNQIGLNMKDAQALESRQFSIPEICRWFSISPHLVGDLSRATFSNIEHLALEFVKMTLAQWICRWEEEFRRCVLTAEEKAAGYFLRLNLDGLLRGDFQTRMAGYASALQNGHMNVDEVRELDDRNPLPDGAGEDYHIQLNMQPLPIDSNQQNGLVKLTGRNAD